MDEMQRRAMVDEALAVDAWLALRVNETALVPAIVAAHAPEAFVEGEERLPFVDASLFFGSANPVESALQTAAKAAPSAASRFVRAKGNKKTAGMKTKDEALRAHASGARAAARELVGYEEIMGSTLPELDGVGPDAATLDAVAALRAPMGPPAEISGVEDFSDQTESERTGREPRGDQGHVFDKRLRPDVPNVFTVLNLYKCRTALGQGLLTQDQHRRLRALEAAMPSEAVREQAGAKNTEYRSLWMMYQKERTAFDASVRRVLYGQRQYLEWTWPLVVAKHNDWWATLRALAHQTLGENLRVHSNIQVALIPPPHSERSECRADTDTEVVVENIPAASPIPLDTLPLPSSLAELDHVPLPSAHLIRDAPAVRDCIDAYQLDIVTDEGGIARMMAAPWETSLSLFLVVRRVVLPNGRNVAFVDSLPSLIGQHHRLAMTRVIGLLLHDTRLHDSPSRVVTLGGIRIGVVEKRARVADAAEVARSVQRNRPNAAATAEPVEATPIRDPLVPVVDYYGPAGTEELAPHVAARRMARALTSESGNVLVATMTMRNSKIAWERLSANAARGSHEEITAQALVASGAAVAKGIVALPAGAFLLTRSRSQPVVRVLIGAQSSTSTGMPPIPSIAKMFDDTAKVESNAAFPFLPPLWEHDESDRLPFTRPWPRTLSSKRNVPSGGGEGEPRKRSAVVPDRSETNERRAASISSAQSFQDLMNQLTRKPES